MKITTYPIPECGSFLLKVDNMAEFILDTIAGTYGSAQESIMRIDSANISNELMKSIEVT